MATTLTTSTVWTTSSGGVRPQAPRVGDSVVGTFAGGTSPYSFSQNPASTTEVFDVTGTDTVSGTYSIQTKDNGGLCVVNGTDSATGTGVLVLEWSYDAIKRSEIRIEGSLDTDGATVSIFFPRNTESGVKRYYANSSNPLRFAIQQPSALAGATFTTTGIVRDISPDSAAANHYTFDEALAAGPNGDDGSGLVATITVTPTIPGGEIPVGSTTFSFLEYDPALIVENQYNITIPVGKKKPTTSSKLFPPHLAKLAPFGTKEALTLLALVMTVSVIVAVASVPFFVA